MMIQLDSIEKTYGSGQSKICALKNVSLSVGKGEYAVVIGPSGSGKTALFNILGLLDSPSGGSYSFEGYDIRGLSDKERARIRNRNFGFLFRDFRLFPELNALENVMLPMAYANVPVRARRERAINLLANVGLSHIMFSLPESLSGWEKQHIAVARALANEPDIILADEPTGDLPSDRGRLILDMLAELNAQGVTILMMTHNETLAEGRRRTIRMKDGKSE